MGHYLITCRSLTQAQKSLRLLEKAGFSAYLIKAPQKLTGGGCAYALSIYKRADEAITMLERMDMINGKVFKKVGDEFAEVK